MTNLWSQPETRIVDCTHRALLHPLNIEGIEPKQPITVCERQLWVH